MVKLDFTQQINAPVEKVFPFVTDFRNNTKWQSGIIESSQTPDGPTQVGTLNKVVRTFLGQRIEATIEVVELVPNKKFAIRSVNAPIHLSMQQTYEPAEGGTKINIHVEMEGAGFFKLAEGALAGNVKKEFEAQTQKLKELMEA